MLRPGTFLGNRYEIIGMIGSGGMSYVYKAKCHKLNRYVAIKVLKPDYANDQGFVTKFRNEARAAASLSHPNIVSIYDVGEEKGIHYIVMELIDGITLKRYIEHKKKLGIRESIEIAMQVARGLEAAHRQHIIHRDIKPQNIMISREGKVKVTDFGIARAASAQTISSSTMGSVHYISPEQTRGGYCEERSDIYSLGITMYEMLTGRIPFEGDSTVAVALQHIQAEMVPPRQIEPMIPVSLEKIIFKCTQKKTDRRYASATELIEDLKKCLTMPNGDFVKFAPLTTNEPTQVFTESEINEVREKAQEAAARRIAGENQNRRAAEQSPQKEKEKRRPLRRQDPVRTGRDDETDSHFEKIVTYIMIGVVILVIVIGVVIGMRACGILSFDGGNTTEESDISRAVVPSLLGKSVDQAEAEVKELGLDLRVSEYSANEEYAAGEIYYQSIDEGTTVEKSTIIEVKVSNGNNLLVIPGEVVGALEQDARRILYKAGFTNVDPAVDLQYSDTVPEGTVLGTNPEAGSAADVEYPIKLILSAGPEVRMTSVPDLSNQGLSNLSDLLAASGLVLGQQTRQNDDYVDYDCVISQDPVPGTQLPEGSAVNVVISDGSSKVYVPNVIYITPSQAESYLIEYGLTVGNITYEETPDPSMWGYTISQSIGSGNYVEAGTSVDLVIGQQPSGTAETAAPG